MVSNRLLLTLAVLTLLMGGVALGLFVQLRHARTEVELAQQQILARDRVIIRQEQAAGRPVGSPATAPADPTAAYRDTAKVLPPAAAVFADELGTLTGENISNLIKAGTPEDPEAYLAADLKKQATELFGGPVTDVRLLTEHLALAAFSAPDLSGTALLRYRITGPGQVTWEVLDGGGK